MIFHVAYFCMTIRRVDESLLLLHDGRSLLEENPSIAHIDAPWAKIDATDRNTLVCAYGALKMATTNTDFINMSARYEDPNGCLFKLSQIK